MNTKKYRSEPQKEKIIHRLKIISGHIDKIIEMTESDAYCIDIIHQSLAVSSALKKVNETVLENHLTTCVATSIRKGKDKEVISEIMEIIKKA